MIAIGALLSGVLGGRSQLVAQLINHIMAIVELLAELTVNRFSSRRSLTSQDQVDNQDNGGTTTTTFNNNMVAFSSPSGCEEMNDEQHQIRRPSFTVSDRVSRISPASCSSTSDDHLSSSFPPPSFTIQHSQLTCLLPSTNEPSKVSIDTLHFN